MMKAEHVHLRALEPEDLRFLFELENDPAVWQVSNTLAPYSKFVLRQYLENASADIYTTRQLRLVIGSNTAQAAIGAIDLYEFEPQHLRAGVGISILQNYRGKNLASEALNLLLEYARTHLQLHQVYCTIPENNEASLRLFRRAGFREVGLRHDWLRTPGGWVNVLEMQRIL